MRLASLDVDRALRAGGGVGVGDAAVEAFDVAWPTHVRSSGVVAEAFDDVAANVAQALAECLS